jgi:hypothetical protein
MPALAVPAFAPPAAPQLPPAPARQSPPPTAAPVEEPAAPAKKSNLPLIIALNVVAIAAIAVIVYFVMKH